MMNTSSRTQSHHTIGIVGLGYVGLPLALLAQQQGHEVLGVDTDTSKVSLLRKGKSPFQLSPVLEKELARMPLSATSDFAALSPADIIIICVPTPVHDDHTPDLTPVREAVTALAPHIGDKRPLIILESTVNPGVSETIVIPLLEKHSGKKVGKDFLFAHCPERINPGDPYWGIQNISRVVGGVSEESTRAASAFYAKLLSEASVHPMASLKEAEAVKVVENSFRDINIAFVNELARSFSKLGIDVVHVIDGAATKPFAFLAHYPGCGVGGHCIPVDPYYLIEYAQKNGFEHDFLRLARRINSTMPHFTVEQLMRALNEAGLPLNNTAVALLGLAYKPNIDDCRESPAFEIQKLLTENGASVTTFDPFVPEYSTAKSLEEALEHSEAVVIATAHDAFCAITPEVLLSHNIRVVVDGRNCLAPDAFHASPIVYKGIGR